MTRDRRSPERRWKAQLLVPDTHRLLPGGELRIAEIRERVVVVTMAGTAAPASTVVRLWLPEQ